MTRKIVILDIGSDRNGTGLMNMVNDGAFPDSLGEVIKNLIPSLFPVDSKCSREMWPGVGFPVGDPMHAIINHLYATAQKPMIPDEILNGMSNEVSDIMDASGDFDPEMKAMVMKGSKKIYNRTLPDGTEITVEIRKGQGKPCDMAGNIVEKEASKDLDDLIADINNRKTASAQESVRDLALDGDKLMKRAWMSSFVHDGAENIVREVGALCGRSMKLAVAELGEVLDPIIRKIAEMEDSDPNNIIEGTRADKDTDNKVLIAGEVFDKRKFTKYPFDSRENAVKAVSKQVADLITDKLSGNVEEDKLRDAADISEQDPGLKLMDRIVTVLGYK